MRYTAKMNYSEDSVLKLTQTQYDVFQHREKSIITIIAIIVLFISFYRGLNSVFGILLFFIGCILITGLNTRPRAAAKQLIRQLNGQFPSFIYTFTETGFSSDKEEVETKYSSVIRLIENKGYMYIYVTQEKAYMLDSSTIRPDDLDGFRKFVSKKTKMEWSKPFSLFSLTIDKIPGLFRSEKH